ncbi:arsenite efflux transporter metallochaperone ArsD (plasmid) [Cereibacter azotoformans]|uniref:arsenite efflux transporter metallochaperone ArsD n=1 Tax=Cereibacter azotoformans TaxID=43057 RepID=UPI001EEB65CD|nr:arsenite efflux transporter metallochaperone ArsD [Cereibacter azotoformans]ULB12465.1 arsenite efflux transporter metallochaperone ArsD [Cereibacter azotoformans]
MTTLTVYDPAMCCSTGICGTEVDQRLVQLAADLDWLKAQGVTVSRFGLSREPAEFAANETIRQIMQESEGDDLPAFLVNGTLVAKARYPDRMELAGWTGLASGSCEADAGQVATPSACCAPSQAEAASGCCGGSKAASGTGQTGSCC